MISAEDILSLTPPSPDRRLAYGSDPNQFLDVRTPKGAGPNPVLLNIHGGYWRSRYDLAHAGHLCEAFRLAGVATFNVEYRRVGNEGGGWPGTFEDIRAAFRFIRDSSDHLGIDPKRLVVMGHSAGGQLALCLAAHEVSLRRVISLAGVVNLRKAWKMHLSHDAVAEFLHGKPEDVPEHFGEADPTELSIPQAHQWILHGKDDDTVPPAFSREYAELKKGNGEQIDLMEIANCGHFELLDPRSDAFKNYVAPCVQSALSVKA